MYIDTGSSVPGVSSKSRDLADENSKMLTEWKWFETTVLYRHYWWKTNYRHAQTPENIWTNFWKRHLSQVESWTTKLCVCIFVYSKEIKCIPIRTYKKYLFKDHGGSRGHVESETLPQHLRNIPKSSFPNISSKLTHVPWICTRPCVWLVNSMSN